MKKTGHYVKSENKETIKIIGQYIKDLSFENFAAQEGTFSKEPKKLKMDLNISKKTVRQDVFEVTLNFFVVANNNKSKVFLLELCYANLFEISGIPNNDDLNRKLLVDCPNLMFPFLRHIVFNVTRDSGLTPVNLDYMNFHKLYEQRKN